MKESANRLFNLYSGEGRQAFIFAFFGFILFFAIFLGYKLSDMLFVMHLSTTMLPAVYATIASIVICTAALSIYCYNRFSAKTIFFRLLLIAIIFYSAIAAAFLFNLASSSNWTWFFLKVCTQIIWISLLSSFWTFLDEYYHFQDAKRIYTIFNSSVYLGLTSAGLLIRSGLFDAKEIFSLVVILLAVVIGFAPRLISKFPTVPDDAESIAESPQEQDSLIFFFRNLLASKFALFLMLSNLIVYLLMTTTEFGYFSSFQKYFNVSLEPSSTSDTNNAVTRFWGTCLAIAGFCNLITGWFFYSRAVLRFGVTTLILLTPLAFLSTYSAWPFDPTLFVPLMGFFIVETLLPVIDDNNFNLLLNAVPIRLKSRVRVMIESFSEPVGMLLASILLSAAFFDWKFLGLLLAVGLFFIALTIRSNYYTAIFKNLKDHALYLHRSLRDWMATLPRREKKACEERLLALISHPDPEFQKWAIEAIFAANRMNLLKRALENAHSLSVSAQIHFIKLVDRSPYHAESFVLEAVSQWSREPSGGDLQAYIDFFLAKHGLLHPDKAQYNLHAEELLARGAAIIALEHSFAHQTLKSVTLNRQVALEQTRKLLESKDEDELSLGLLLLGFEGSHQNIEILIDYLKHPSLKIAKQAIIALEECLSVHNIRHAKAIIDEIRARSDSEFRAHCFGALFKIGHTSLIRPLIALSPLMRPQEARLLERMIGDLGLKTVPSLVSIVTDMTLPDRARITAGKILATLSLPQLNANLPLVLKKELQRAYFYFYYGRTLPENWLGHDLTLLREGLLSSFQSVIDFIIQLLGASKWIEDSELIVFSLRNKNPKISSQALETLEMCCERSIFRHLYPLIGDLPLKDKIKIAEKVEKRKFSVPEVLNILGEGPNTLDLILATTWQYRLELPGWQAALRRQMARREEIFFKFAYELLET
jgi:hypothetical protein